MPPSATPFEQGDAKGSVPLAEQPGVTVMIDDHRRFHELQAPAEGRFHEVSEVSTKPRARERGAQESCAHIGQSRHL